MPPSSDARLIEVRTAADWSAVNDLLLDFEDGTVKEVWLDSQEWVGPDDILRYGGGGVAVVIVQCQGPPEPFGAEMRFSGVTLLEVDLEAMVWPACAEDGRADTWTVEFLSCRVQARECIVTYRGDALLGRGPLLGG